MNVSILALCRAVVISVFLAMTIAMVSWNAGMRVGTCTELCRPAKFDRGQDVNGGCLCVGSDKVLWIKEAP